MGIWPKSLELLDSFVTIPDFLMRGLEIQSCPTKTVLGTICCRNAANGETTANPLFAPFRIFDLTQLRLFDRNGA